MKRRYRVLFHGVVKDVRVFHEEMSRLGVQAQVAGQMIQNAPVIVKQNLTLGIAHRYAEAIKKAGGKVIIQEQGKSDVFENTSEPPEAVTIVPMEAFTMCPQCGLKQVKGKSCVRCGFVLRGGTEGLRFGHAAGY
jgi:hypothetical protein